MNITRKLSSRCKGKIIACEPNIKGTEINGIPLYPLDKAINAADIIVVLVNHREFYHLNQEFLKEKVIIDTRGIFN